LRIPIKRIAIIGASGTIGSQFVKTLSLKESVEKIFALTRQPVNFLSSKIKNIALDYYDEASIKNASAIAHEDGKLDLVIVATGILELEDSRPEKSFLELSFTKLQTLFLANAAVPAMMMKYFLPKTNSNGMIFATLSARIGSITDNQLGGWYSYRASKSALNMLIKTASIETHRTNKQAIVVGLHPGTVDSPLTKPFQANIPKQKLFSSETSVNHLLTVINNLEPSDTGKCFAWDGKEILP